MLLHTARGRHLVRASLASLEARLDPSVFVRAHRAAIVNLDAVQELTTRDASCLRLVDGTRVPVSRARRRQVEAAIGAVETRPQRRDSSPCTRDAKRNRRATASGTPGSRIRPGGPIMRRHGLGPAGLRPAARRRHRGGHRRRPRLGRGQAADPRGRQPDAARAPAALGRPAPVRRPPGLPAGGVQRQPRRLGAAAGLARLPDHHPSRPPADLRRHMELRRAGVVERPRLPGDVDVVVDADALSGRPGRHRGWPGRRRGDRRRAPASGCTFYNDVLGAILGARPIDAPALLDAFEPVLAKARDPPAAAGARRATRRVS